MFLVNSSRPTLPLGMSSSSSPLVFQSTKTHLLLDFIKRSNLPPTVTLDACRETSLSTSLAPETSAFAYSYTASYIATSFGFVPSFDGGLPFTASSASMCAYLPTWVLSKLLLCHSSSACVNGMPFSLAILPMNSSTSNGGSKKWLTKVFAPMSLTFGSVNGTVFLRNCMNLLSLSTTCLTLRIVSEPCGSFHLSKSSVHLNVRV